MWDDLSVSLECRYQQGQAGVFPGKIRCRGTYSEP